MRRAFLLNTITSVSVIVFLATASLWIRSYWATDYLWWDQRGTYGFTSSRGEFIVWRQELRLTWTPPDPKHSSSYPAYDLRRTWLGFDYRLVLKTGDGVAVPAWAVTITSAILPAMWTRRRLRQRGNREAGKCAACGYDLRATPERCPECGRVPETKMNGTATYEPATSNSSQ